MPRVRDISYTSSASLATSIACFLPNYAQNDLLLAICTTDTGSQTWSLAGWTQYFSETNTSNIAVMYKIAGASESDPTFAYTVSETADVFILAIEDVDTADPFDTTYAGADIAATGMRGSMPTLTTTVANCLLIHTAVNSVQGQTISILENGAVSLGANDGTAHGVCVAWSFKRAAGTTASNINWSKTGNAAGRAITMAIAPPTGGATVIPTYVVTDSSQYIDPINGIVAFDSNSYQSTWTTYFGSTINGLPFTASSNASLLNTGINPSHHMSRTTMLAAVNEWCGNNLHMATANKPNVSGKNVLAHLRPETPRVLRYTRNVSTPDANGCTFGMSSSAGNYITWHVHGAGTSWPASAHVPVIINSGCTKGIQDTVGTFDPTSVSDFGFAYSGGGIAQYWSCCSLWALDTTILSGGNATYPVNVTDIWDCCANGKERLSILKQGSSQILVLQPLQFGDGGTNQLYLDLTSTAIEFPEQYNLATKQVFYCSTDNVVGLTYYAGASDTVIHTNAIVSSESPFHWRIHASFNTSATYDFNGLSIIGAGDVTLKSGMTFNGMTFSNCSAITQNSATITNAAFNDSVVNSSDPTAADNISYSDFTSSGTGHGLVITGTASNITLNGITWTGYAGTDGSTGNEAIYVNIGSGSMNITIANGGNTPSIRTAGATVTVISGAVAVTVTAVDTAGTPIQNARVLLRASNGTGDFPYQDSVTITRSGTTATVSHTAHGMATNDYIQILGADQPEYDGVKQITYINANSYSYTVSGSPATPATGTITGTFVALYGLTDVNGEAAASRVYTNPQPVVGWCRKSSGSPYYQQGILTGTISATTGFTATGVMASDE